MESETVAATCHSYITFFLALVLPASGVCDIQSTTQTLSANISAYGKLSLPTSVSLRSVNQRFGSDLTGNLTVSYWARTSEGGSGAVTVQAVSDFTPAGGPSIGSVTYFCSGATLGSACSGNQAIATSSQTTVVTLPSGVCTGGGGTCSTQDPNTVLMTMSAPNKPRYKTGTYSTLITFTISTL